MDLIQENISVLLQKGKVLKAAKVERGKKVVFEKLHFKLEDAIGHPFGTLFEVVRNQLCVLEKATEKDGNEEIQPENEVKESVDDNRLLVDSHGKSQSLKREEIVEMKAKGTKGEDIIDQIVKNSASFSGKTIYSQKKYLKKKKLKHLNHIKILKPRARLICRMYENREPAKICHLRIDTLSQILTMANIHHGSKVAVVETCSGLLLGLIMQRLGGSGTVLNLHSGETPANFHAINHFNFPEKYWSLLHSLPLCKIGPLVAKKTFEESVGELPSNDTTENNTSKSIAISSIKSENGDTELLPEPSEDQNKLEVVEKPKKGQRRDLTEAEKCEIRLERRNKRLRHQFCAWSALDERDVDALIVACKYHPTPLVLTLLEFLAPSRPFVVYCESREPLMELFVQISVSGKAVNMKISDTFMRYYQVLPEQTHPHVMMSPSGGFLLTGITTEPKSGYKRETTNKSSLASDEIPAKKSKTS